jgi:hypothetical protein
LGNCVLARKRATPHRHHAFGNEIYNDACFNQPRDKRDERNKQSGSRSERAEACGIPTRDLDKRRTGEQ